jgi:hypothetical protein
MIDCKKLIHPFQNDPGVSQSQRVIDELLSGTAKIDGRTLADFLNFFVKLAPHINYYDSNLQISDWQPFFKKSFPFLLASISAYNPEFINEKFSFYTTIFQKKPTPAGLQLSLSYTFYNIIKKINEWYLATKDTKLQIVTTLEQNIQNKLQQPLKQFVSAANASRKWYCTNPIDLTDISANPFWNLELPDQYSIDNSFMSAGKSNAKRMVALQKEIVAIMPAFLDGIKAISAQAVLDLPQSFNIDTDTLSQKNAPHLALLFCFLKIFQQQQENLNGFTGKHLDYFYKQVLKIRPQDAIPDKTNIVFQLQNQVPNRLLQKNTLVKDAQDINKADIEFSLDDDIVVNEAQVTDIRTLFLNNQTAFEKTYVEGVYMAPNATKANGVDKDFSDTQPKNYPTLGSKYSEFIPAAKTTPAQYPGARIGFILASEILLLDKAKRTIDIKITCKLNENCKSAPGLIKKTNTTKNVPVDEEVYPSFIPSQDLYDAVRPALSETYVYITEDLIRQAIKKGIEKTVEDSIRSHLIDHCKKSLCEEKIVFYKEETTVEYNKWTESFLKINDKLTLLQGDALMKLLDEIFIPRQALKVSFSGDKDWILPDRGNLAIGIRSSEKLSDYHLHISAFLTADQEAVTFYNKTNLKEDFSTTQPLIKIELDDVLKVSLEKILRENRGLTNISDDCCLDRPTEPCGREVSLYHFLRNLNIIDTKIEVGVCGLKNFIVQNDEILENINAPIYPFTARPKVNNNFYIGSEEIFLKNWKNIWINVNWKDLPAHFHEYYHDYKKECPELLNIEGDRKILLTKESGKSRSIHHDDFLMRVSYLQEDDWYDTKGEKECICDGGAYDLIFPPLEKPLSPCFESIDQFGKDFNKRYHYSPDSFAGLPQRKKEAVYTGIKKYDGNATNCFLRMTLKCIDFQHDIYPIILASYLINLAKTEIARETQRISIGNPPNQPWTPIISNMSIDYTAVAGPDNIDLIHLYPYDGTYKQVELKLQPTVFAPFCDEGTLFLGLQNLVPGSNVNILFQLAEATSDSESDPQTVYWYYLADNKWTELRPGFEVIDDATDNLTRSGIIKFSFPNNISSGNTVMPQNLYWIKATVPQNSGAVSELISVYAQAMSATFTNQPANDKLRLSTPLAAGSVSKLSVPDSNIKQVSQPGPGFGGTAQEIQGPAYYLRVSELLRHKGRAIQKFDYERLALQEFPELFKVKCINHSFALNANNYVNDFPVAPGYVLLAVIPDLNILQAGNSFEPKVPVSILEDIETKMRARSSPFVRFRAMNPRYEKMKFCITVQLMPDKDPIYFPEKLKEDLREFLAPWAVGKYDKLSFGECVNKSDIVNFIETLEYVDYIVELLMFEEEAKSRVESQVEICPKTPRSILIAGEIDVSIQLIECEKWNPNDPPCDHKKILINNHCKKNETTLIQ